MRTVADVPEAYVPTHLKQLQFLAAGFGFEIINEQVLSLGDARPTWQWSVRPIRKAGDHMIMKIFEAPTLTCIGAFLHGLEHQTEVIRKQLRTELGLESDDGTINIGELIAVLVSQRDNARAGEDAYKAELSKQEKTTALSNSELQKEYDEGRVFIPFFPDPATNAALAANPDACTLCGRLKKYHPEEAKNRDEHVFTREPRS